MACSNPRYLNKYTNVLGQPIKIPCGYCLNCKSGKITNWTKRLTYEYNISSSSFVTCTYDDNHSFYKKGYYRKSLNRIDLHRFIDNLRHYLSNNYKFSTFTDELNRINFKYFAVGEYGGKLGRPHYHILFFGLSPAMAMKVVEKCWNKGSTDVEPMLIGSIRYVMKYFDKQQNGENLLSKYYDKGLNPPFISCSPGIGSDYYFAQAKNISETGCIKFGNQFVNVPNYWINKLSVFSPDMINKRSKFLMKQQKELLKTSKKFGFKDFDSYMTYISRIKEKDLIEKMRTMGVPVEDTLKYGYLAWKIPKSYNKKIIYEALEA